MKRQSRILLAYFLVCCALVGCTAIDNEKTGLPEGTLVAHFDTEIQQATKMSTNNANIEWAEDYEQVQDTLSQFFNEDNESFFSKVFNGVTGGTKMIEESMDFADDAGVAPADPSSGASEDYSQTNVQVAGVDEADIVKTDGKYIYALTDNTVYIIRAKGKNTAVSAQIKLSENENEGSGAYSNEMFLSDGKLAVIRTQWGNGTGDDKTVAEVYDVSNPKETTFLYKTGQSGNYLSSRLLNGTIYLVSNKYVYQYDPKQPSTYIPQVLHDDEYKVMPIESICIMPNPSTSYTVVSGIDLESGNISGSVSVLGGGSEMYMSNNSLYVAGREWKSTESEPRKEDQYSVVDVYEGNTTEILRFSLDGAPKLVATGSVRGALLNQFSMDEHNGYLRIVTTVDDYRYTRYTDDKHGWVNSVSTNMANNTNALYVLDDTLNQVGAIEGLAETERVYSVRFDGDVGYFVTFRQTDPLYTVDLSDPENPVVQSALKIPGFSNYLHVYAPGRLFGLGMDADEDTGATKGLKLSMFDTSNPFDVTEMWKISVDGDGSAAQNNHKAILISPQKDIIGFPTWDSYMVYGYNDTEGFYLKGQVTIDGQWHWDFYDCRGLYIGDEIYLVSKGGVLVLSLETMTPIGQTDFKS